MVIKCYFTQRMMSWHTVHCKFKTLCNALNICQYILNLKAALIFDLICLQHSDICLKYNTLYEGKCVTKTAVIFRGINHRLHQISNYDSNTSSKDPLSCEVRFFLSSSSHRCVIKIGI